jgi:hypothetical protein
MRRFLFGLTALAVCAYPLPLLAAPPVEEEEELDGSEGVGVGEEQPMASMGSSEESRHRFQVRFGCNMRSFYQRATGIDCRRFAWQTCKIEWQRRSRW